MLAATKSRPGVGMPNNSLQSLIDLLPHAVVLIAVAEEGSFSAAAEELSMSRSTVSQRISALESAVGVGLLHRTTRSLRLTDAGQQLVDDLAPILPRWREAEARVRDFATVPGGQLVVTAPDLMMETYVVPAVKRYRAAYPGIRIELRGAISTLPLMESDIDVAVRAGPLPASQFGASLVWEGVHIAVATKELCDEHEASHPDQLADAPWIELRGRRKMTAWQHDDDRTAPFAAEAELVTNNLSTFVELAAAGTGFAVLPELFGSRMIADGSVVRALPGWSADPISFHVVTPSARKLSSTSRRFIAELKKEFHSV